jgi:ABC-type transport system involved in cytochrome bd biosynthesis fused ATPase/permease subunit
LKTQAGNKAFYWPTTDSLTFAFDRHAENSRSTDAALHEFEDIDEDENSEDGHQVVKNGFSSGERQLQTLQEIVANTHAEVYLLDEWDANLDVHNRAQAEKLVEQLAARALVVEISHRDRA